MQRWGPWRRHVIQNVNVRGKLSALLCVCLVFMSLPLCSGDCFVEKSSREAEEKKLPPALRVARVQNPASKCRAARDVRATWWTENMQTHPNSSLLSSQRCDGCPALSLDWDTSVYMNTHNVPSGIPPPPHHSAGSELLSHVTFLPSGRKHICKSNRFE